MDHESRHAQGAHYDQSLIFLVLNAHKAQACDAGADDIKVKSRVKKHPGFFIKLYKCLYNIAV